MARAKKAKPGVRIEEFAGEGRLLEGADSTNPAPSGGETTAEMAERTGMSDWRVRQLLRQAKRQGRLECVGKKAERRIDGAMVHKPCYRILEAGG